MSIFGGTINTSEISKVSSWTYYTPKFAGSGAVAATGSNLIGRYFNIGKLVYVQISFKLATAGSTIIMVTLPLPQEVSVKVTGTGMGFCDVLMGTVTGAGGVTIQGQILEDASDSNSKACYVSRVDGAALATASSAYALSGWYVKK